MSTKTILKIGDMIGYSDNKKAMIEKIRIISKGEFVEQYIYDSEAEDVVLTLNDNIGVFNLWLKNNPICVFEEKKEKKSSQ
jgi:hypothetical protein